MTTSVRSALSLPLLFTLGLAAGLLWPTGPGERSETLERAVEAAQQRSDSLAAYADSLLAVADSSTEAHAALVESTDSITAHFQERVQTATASAAATADSIRARVDSATSELVTRMGEKHAEALQAEESKTATWRVRALSAEAGWRDERLARTALEEQVESMVVLLSAKDALIGALEDDIARANRHKKLFAIAGGGFLIWSLK